VLKLHPWQKAKGLWKMACPTRHHHARLDWALPRRIAIRDTQVQIILHFEKKTGLLIHSASKTSSQKLGLLESQLPNVVGVQAMRGEPKAPKNCSGPRVQVLCI
jgi:hypothetical protein